MYPFIPFPLRVNERFDAVVVLPLAPCVGLYPRGHNTIYKYGFRLVVPFINGEVDVSFLWNIFAFRDLVLGRRLNCPPQLSTLVSSALHTYPFPLLWCYTHNNGWPELRHWKQRTGSSNLKTLDSNDPRRGQTKSSFLTLLAGNNLKEELSQGKETWSPRIREHLVTMETPRQLSVPGNDILYGRFFKRKLKYLSVWMSVRYLGTTRYLV